MNLSQTISTGTSQRSLICTVVHLATTECADMALLARCTDALVCICIWYGEITVQIT